MQQASWARESVGVIRQTIERWKQVQGWQRGASIAFFGLFSLAPFFALFLSAIGLFAGSELFTQQMYRLTVNIFGESTEPLWRAILSQDVFWRGSLTSTIWSGVLAALGGAGVLVELQRAVHALWGSEQQMATGFIKRGIGKIQLSFFTVVGLCALIAAFLFTLAFSALFGAVLRAELVPGVATLWVAFTNLLALPFIFLALCWMYRVFSHHQVSWAHAARAALAATVLLTVGKLVVQIFAQGRPIFTMFGAGSAVVYLIFWSFYAAQAFLLGAAFAEASFSRLKTEPRQKTKNVIQA